MVLLRRLLSTAALGGRGGSGSSSSSSGGSGSSRLVVRNHAYSLPTLRLRATPSVETLEAMLGDQVRRAPQFYKDAPLVLDFDRCGEDVARRAADFVSLVRRLGFLPVGLANLARAATAAAPAVGHEGTEVKDAPRALDVPMLVPAAARKAHPVSDVVPSSSAAAADVSAQEQQQQGAADEAGVHGAMMASDVVPRSVRSGEQLVAAPGRSLVVLGNVGSGAELIADGDVMVFGALRGRVSAGVGGRRTSKIMAQRCYAEFISIGNCFVSGEESEGGKAAEGRATVVSLGDDGLLHFHVGDAAVMPALA